LLAAVPNLPRPGWARVSLVSLVGVATGAMALFVATEWSRFDRLNADFRAILPAIPGSPRLMYLVFDHRGLPKRHSPFVHFPAWVQAEKGGWLSFHFARWGIFPVRYREPNAGVVPPPLPHDWEWRPQDFRVERDGAWFDTFLVRHSIDPSELFAADPRIRLVTREGTWWLYRRDTVE
jgi:hypothetical protein